MSDKVTTIDADARLVPLPPIVVLLNTAEALNNPIHEYDGQCMLEVYYVLLL